MTQPTNYITYPHYLRDADDGLMKPIRLNNPLVYKSHYDGDYEAMLKGADSLFKIVNEGDVPLETGPAKSTASLADKSKFKKFQVDNPYGLKQGYEPHLNPAYKDFYEWIRPRVQEVLTRWTYPNNMPWYITKSWVNEHFKKGETLEHVHGSTSLVVTMYPAKDKLSGNIWFRDTEHEIRAHEFNEQASYAWREIPCVTGDVLIFPGWLPHRTGVSFSDTRRVVCTTNINVDEKEFIKNMHNNLTERMNNPYLNNKVVK